MKSSMNEQAQRVISLASDEARRLNHAYVGTEHILLGLLLEGSCDSTGTLARLGLTAEAVRSEIEKLVTRGPDEALPKDLPLTPRAKRAVELAAEEAELLSLSHVSPEHLLIGLSREMDGVAGKVIQNLGLDPTQVRAEAMKIRMMQVRLVERAVRPVRAGIKHKRKMREELLAHLAAIYEEELERTHDSLAAMESAATRFGDPMQLSCELQATVPASARRDFYIQRWLGWRPPESVVRMMARSSVISLGLMSLLLIPFVIAVVVQGWDHAHAQGLRSILGMMLFTPLAQFGIGVCYYKVRDSLFGVFGARRSIMIALLWSVIAGLVVVASSLAFIVTVEGTLANATGSLPILATLVTFISITCMLAAKVQGMNEIRDTIWATMDLNSAS